MSEPGEGEASNADGSRALAKPEPAKPQPTATPVEVIPLDPSPRGGAEVTHVQQEYLRVSVGVLTDPQSLAEYERAIPGVGKEILQKFFERTAQEMSHRHSMEKQALQAEQSHGAALVKQGDRGQWMAFCIALAGFVLVGYLAWLQQPVLAGILAVLDIGGLVTSFLYGRKKQAEEAIAQVQKPDENEQAQPAEPAPQLPEPKKAEPAPLPSRPKAKQNSSGPNSGNRGKPRR